MYVIVAIYDRAAKMYGPLIQERSAVAGIRAFGDSLKSGRETTVIAHPEDFDLVTFGTFNEATGELAVHDAQLLINAATLLREIRAREAAAAADEESISALDRAAGRTVVTHSPKLVQEGDNGVQQS